jgi:hypothetical protein
LFFDDVKKEFSSKTQFGVDKQEKSFIISSCQAGVAQLVEQLTCNQQVISPNLIAGSIT